MTAVEHPKVIVVNGARYRLISDKHPLGGLSVLSKDERRKLMTIYMRAHRAKKKAAKAAAAQAASDEAAAASDEAASELEGVQALSVD